MFHESHSYTGHLSLLSFWQRFKESLMFHWAFLNINFIQAYDPIKTRKSKIASTILDRIKTFFAKPEFVGNSARVKDYVKWALANIRKMSL